MMSSTPRIFIGAATVRMAGELCGHCLDAVQSAVRQVPGVRSVTVDHAAATVAVVADQPVDRSDIDAAAARTGHRPLPTA